MNTEEIDTEELDIPDISDDLGAPDSVIAGQILHKFSRRRVAAAQKIGFGMLGRECREAQERLQAAKEKDPDQTEEDGMYPGVLDDYVLVGWLCSISDDKVSLAKQRPGMARVKADDWADEMGIEIGNDRWDELVEAVNEALEGLGELSGMNGSI